MTSHATAPDRRGRGGRTGGERVPEGHLAPARGGRPATRSAGCFGTLAAKVLSDQPFDEAREDANALKRRPAPSRRSASRSPLSMLALPRSATRCALAETESGPGEAPSDDWRGGDRVPSHDWAGENAMLHHLRREVGSRIV
jgi:hypothetical protein